MAKLTRVFVVLLVLGLAATSAYLFAERNRHRYYLGTEGRELVVARGAWVPGRQEPIKSDDPSLEAAYAPIELPVGAPPAPERVFEERHELDSALFEVLASWAAPRIQSGDAAQLADAFRLLQRASALSGISGEQAQRLRKLRSEVAYYEAHEKVVHADTLLTEARELLAQARGARGADAEDLLDRVDAAAEALDGRGGLPPAAPAPPVPPAAPAPAPEATAVPAAP